MNRCPIRTTGISSRSATQVPKAAPTPLAAGLYSAIVIRVLSTRSHPLRWRADDLDFYTGMGECSASGRYLPRVGHHLQAVACLTSTIQSEIINRETRPIASPVPGPVTCAF
jgi:hypothetical protein